MEDQLHSVIESLEVELLQNDIRKNTKRLSELIADDFIEFGASGKRYNKKIILDSLPNQEEVRYLVQDFSLIQLSPNTVLATYRLEMDNIFKGEFSVSLRSSIWQFRNNNWKIMFHQGTPQAFAGGL